MIAGAARLPRDISATSRALLEDLCAISSESGNADGLRRVAARLYSELERHGLVVEIVEEPDAHGAMQPVLLARGPAAGDGHLLLVGHMDTVLPAVPPRLDGPRMLATGALDMKGGLAMLVAALDTLAASSRKPPADLLLVAVPDEESEGAISTAAMRRYSERARLVLVLEPGRRVRRRRDARHGPARADGVEAGGRQGRRRIPASPTGRASPLSAPWPTGRRARSGSPSPGPAAR